MLNIPCRGDHEISRMEVFFVISLRQLTAKTSNRLRRPCDIQTQRISRKEFPLKDVAQKVFGRILVHLHLFYDYALLVHEILFIKTRVGEHVGEQVEGSVEAIIDHLYDESRFLVGGESFEIAAEPVLFNRYLQRRAACRSLEDAMFDEMRYAVELVRFVTRAEPIEEPKSCTADTKHSVG